MAVGLTEQVKRDQTALRRKGLSRPMALTLADGLLPPGAAVFDYGCGRGGDLRQLKALGYKVAGWDPAYLPSADRRPADVVNLGYVINVIESPTERADALRGAWDLAQSLLVVAARPEWEGRTVSGRPYEDGILTGRSTFQKFFGQEELRRWIDDTLQVRSIAAAPGIFYVFRDDLQAQGFLAARVRQRPLVARRTRISEALYEEHRALLEPLIAFVEARGRPPEPFELPEFSEVERRFSSVKAALALARRVTGDHVWRLARKRATEDLIVYLALSAFRGRPRFGQLPRDVQVDIRACFGSHKNACAVADTVLFGAGNQTGIDRACQQSPIGKLTPAALYVHVTALGLLSPLLRVYEGCGRALAGTVQEATIIKLNRIEPKVSYLAYPDFDKDPHPALATSIRVDLRRLHVKFRDFRDSDNPPVLHRKETFVGPEYPGREKFARLSMQEDQWGLLADPSLIGTRAQWAALLTRRGLRLAGHRLVHQRLVGIDHPTW